MPKKWATEITFRGKKYFITTSTYTMRGAQRQAQELRDRGYKVRLVRRYAPKGWDNFGIYTSPRFSWGRGRVRHQV